MQIAAPLLTTDSWALLHSVNHVAHSVAKRYERRCDDRSTQGLPRVFGDGMQQDVAGRGIEPLIERREKVAELEDRAENERDGHTDELRLRDESDATPNGVRVHR